MPFVILCLGVWLHAADTLVTATIMPAAIAEFGGGSYVSWTISLYQIGSIVAGAAIGDLAMRWGLRRVLLVAAGAYGAGCVLGAATPDMAIMLVARLVQGIGGGMMLTLSYVAIEAMFPERLWSRLMAVVAAIWCGGSLLGPLLGGLFAGAGLWRGAFWAFAALAAVLIAGAVVFLGEMGEIRRSRRGYPWVPLALLFAGTLVISEAGEGHHSPVAIALGVAGLALLLLAARLDRDARTRLLPRELMSPGHRVGAGLLMVFALAAATTGFWTYGPLILSLVFDADPLVGGYILAVEGVAWSVATLAVSSLQMTAAPRLIRCGATAVIASVAGFAAALPAGSLAGMVACALLQGAGFGLCWPSIVYRIVSHAAPEERSLAATAASTMQRVGYAVGAAVTGIAANAAGLADGLTVTAGREAAFWIFAVFAPLLAVAALAAWRFTAPRFRSAG